MVKQVNDSVQTEPADDEQVQDLQEENVKLREDNQTLFEQV